MRVRWMMATALAYGLPGGRLLYDQLWEAGRGLTWTRDSTERVLWTLAIFLVSTAWMARQHPEQRSGWIATHAASAFLLGAAIGWGVVELNMAFFAPHPWDTDAPSFLRECINCAQRAPIVRQTLIATALGTMAAAGLAPLVARVVRPRTNHPRTAAPRA